MVCIECTGATFMSAQIGLKVALEKCGPAEVARFGSGKVSAKLKATHRPLRGLRSDYKRKWTGLKCWDNFGSIALYAELVGRDSYSNCEKSSRGVNYLSYRPFIRLNIINLKLT